MLCGMSVDFPEHTQSVHPPECATVNAKRNRSVSVSGRLRSASYLFETGKISNEDMNSMKDLILCQDPLVEKAFIEYEGGDETQLLELVRSGYLQKKSEFAFLDMNNDFGFTSLSLNPLSEENTEGASPFLFNNDYSLDPELGSEYHLPDEFSIDDIHAEHGTYNKRSRSSIDSTDYDSFQQTTVEQSKSNPNAYPNHFDAFPTDGYDEGLLQQNDHSYPFQPHSIHDSMDITQPLYPSGAETSSGFMDTSTLTLSADSSLEERRMQNVGLTPINTQAESQKKFIGIYSPEARKKRVQRFFEKRKQRVWTKKVKYDVRKNFADSRLRVKGRFVKKEDEELLRELMNLA